MPLPRFGRLPAATQAEIFAVARRHFARDGFNGASYGQIIAEVGISKTSAYHYFDGKADLYQAVILDTADRLRAVLGEWTPTASPVEFWDALAMACEALLAHLAAHPEDRALLSTAPRDGEPDRWTAAMMSDAVRLGLVAEDDLELMTALTQAVLDALDRYALDRSDGAFRVAEATRRLPSLLAGLWGIH